jgi:mono/diheme cytochrome c family protein
MRFIVTAACALSAPVVLAAQSGVPLTSRPARPVAAAADQVTYAKNIAPILQAKCQVCHQPNSIAPMSLLTYEDAKAHAADIRDNVSERRMPPWHIDKTVGIQAFKNDRSLSDEQIETIVKWVNAGTPLGDKKDLPLPAMFPDPSRWQLADTYGAPDLVIRSQAFTVAAAGQDKWYRPVTEVGITEERWVRAIEIKPVHPMAKKVVHHVLATLLQQEDGVTGLAHDAHDVQTTGGLFMEWAVGKTGQIFPSDAGKLLLPGSRIRWEIHTHSIGEEFKDEAVELAVYFYPKGVVPLHRTVLNLFNVAPRSDLDIPPNSKSMTQNFYVLQAPARLENFQPHMHMRGRAMSLEAVYPNGRRELISQVSNFQWNWHVNYVYADSVAPLLPKGTTLVFTAWHDNTAQNPNNPDPRQWVGWGDRTVDEMAHCWIDVTYLDQAEFDKLTAARRPPRAERPGSVPPR